MCIRDRADTAQKFVNLQAQIAPQVVSQASITGVAITLPLAFGCIDRFVHRIDHLQAVDGRLEGMCGALKDLGSNYCAKDLPELREEDFACVKDKDQSQAS